MENSEYGHFDRAHSMHKTTNKTDPQLKRSINRINRSESITKTILNSPGSKIRNYSITYK